MKINNNLLAKIGNTPLVDIFTDGKIKIFAKIESFNPSGSIKDRMALYMFKQAQRKGQLKFGGTIIEATTGNTGISFAMIAAIKKYSMIAIMPEDMSIERQKILKLLGAKVILTPKEKGPKGAINLRDRLGAKIKNSWIPNQFNNYDNVLAYKNLMTKEIIKQLKGEKIDYLVAGVGTGGTLIGLGLGLRKYFPKLKIVAVEPKESAVLSGKKPGIHNIQGIGEGFIPSLVKFNLINQVIKISTKQAIKQTKKLITEGYFIGFSSGANYLASQKLAKKINVRVNILTVFPDSTDRYLSLL